VADSSIPRPTFEYIASLEWVRAKENLLLVGPSGTGKSHALVGCGARATEHGMKVRYIVAADLIETLYRGLADNNVFSVGPFGIWVGLKVVMSNPSSVSDAVTLQDSVALRNGPYLR